MKSDAVVGGVAQGETAGSANHSETPVQTQQETTSSVQGGGLTRPGRVRRFFWSVVSHVVFASIIVAGVFGYLYQREILGRLGDELCSDARLGQYMTKPITAAGAPILVPGMAPNTGTQLAAPSVGGPSPLTAPPPAPAEKTPVAEPPATVSPPAPVALASQPPVSTPTQEPASVVPDVAVAPAPSPAPAPSSEERTPLPSPDEKPTISAPTEAVAPTEAPPLPVPAVQEPAPSPTEALNEASAAAPAHLTQSDKHRAPSLTARSDEHRAPSLTARSDEHRAPSLTARSDEHRAPSLTARSDEHRATAEETTEIASGGSAETTQNAPPFNPSVLNSEWQTARRAYVEGKPNAADLYRELVTRYPDIADLRGELGNVLYAGGQLKEAAEQYYEAALRHLKGPQPALAACLVDVVKKIDVSRGDDLEKRVTLPCPYPREK